MIIDSKYKLIGWEGLELPETYYITYHCDTPVRSRIRLRFDLPSLMSNQADRL